MSEKIVDTPYRMAVHMIIQSIINCEGRYVLDGRFVRWGKVEHDLWELGDDMQAVCGAAEAVVEEWKQEDWPKSHLWIGFIMRRAMDNLKAAVDKWRRE